jgi:hypothetical protein
MWHTWKGRKWIKEIGGKPEKRRRPLRRPKCRIEDNIKIDFKEIGLEGVEGI